MGQVVLAIAESINIMGNRSGAAMKERIPGPVQEMAREETAAGATYLDLNIGPARKDGTELMPWIVQTMEEAIDTPLCLDTTNTDAMTAGFKAIKNKETAIMNSISAQPERMEKLMFSALRYELAVKQGALVTEVASKSPADQAGLKPGDVITRFTVDKIDSVDDLIQAIRASQIGQEVEITYWRSENTSTTHATLIESPPPS